MSKVFRVCFGLVSLIGGAYALAAEGGSFRTTLGLGMESNMSSGMHAVVGIVSEDYYLLYSIL